VAFGSAFWRYSSKPIGSCGVKRVFFVRNPLKVFDAVVVAIKIFVVHAGLVFGIRDERFSYKPM